MSTMDVAHRVYGGGRSAFVGFVTTPVPSRAPCKDDRGSKHADWCDPVLCARRLRVAPCRGVRDKLLRRRGIDPETIVCQGGEPPALPEVRRPVVRRVAPEEVEEMAKRWTKAEEAEMQQMAAAGNLSLEYIAERLGRPVGAVEDRLKLLQRGDKAPSRPKTKKPAAVVEAPASPEVPAPEPPKAVIRLAQQVLDHACQYARVSHIADECLAAGLEIPERVQDAVDAEVPRVPMDELRIVEGGRVIGWKAELPAGCGLRTVRVMVE